VTVELPFIGRGGPLSTRVADELAERILDGTLSEGQRLPSEPELSSQLGVSRSVVRDAIRTLSARGLLEVRQGFGTIVRAPSDDRTAEALFELLAREALDVSIAAQAATARTKADLQQLRGLCDEMIEAEGARDWDTVERVHLAFHLAIVDALHVPVLQLVLQPMQRIILLTGLPARTDPPWGSDVHLPVVEAIAAGDAAEAARTMREHYSFVRDPAYREVGAIAFRDVPSLHQRLRPRPRRT